MRNPGVVLRPTTGINRKIGVLLQPSLPPFQHWVAAEHRSLSCRCEEDQEVQEEPQAVLHIWPV